MSIKRSLFIILRVKVGDISSFVLAALESLCFYPLCDTILRDDMIYLKGWQSTLWKQSGVNDLSYTLI